MNLEPTASVYTVVIEKDPMDKFCGCINANDDDKVTVYEALTAYSRQCTWYVRYVIFSETHEARGFEKLGPVRSRYYWSHFTDGKQAKLGEVALRARFVM